MLGSIDLIYDFVLSKIVADRVSELASFITGATTVYGDDDVLERAGEIVMPIAVPTVRDHLRAWTPIPKINVSSSASNRPQL
jgi:hypothetical protein